MSKNKVIIAISRWASHNRCHVDLSSTRQFKPYLQKLAPLGIIRAIRAPFLSPSVAFFGDSERFEIVFFVDGFGRLRLAPMILRGFSLSGGWTPDCCRNSMDISRTPFKNHLLLFFNYKNKLKNQMFLLLKYFEFTIIIQNNHKIV